MLRLPGIKQYPRNLAFKSRYVHSRILELICKEYVQNPTEVIITCDFMFKPLACFMPLALVGWVGLTD